MGSAGLYVISILPLTLYMMEKYIRPGDRVLDIGGGPGRYSIHFAKMGCDVTLVDLSPGNIRFAQQKAAEAGVKFAAYAANCLELDSLNLGEFDHVLLMGPLYHLKEDDDRQKAVEQALLQLKTGGNLYASFILNFAGAIYDLKNGGYVEQDFADGTPTAALIDDILQGRDYIGPSFSSTRFSHQNNILPFMAQFPLTKLHLFGQEGILSPNESELMKRSEGESAAGLKLPNVCWRSPNCWRCRNMQCTSDRKTDERMMSMKTQIETPLAKEFITYALEHDGCVFGEPEHFLKVMKHNTGFVGGLTKYGQDRAGLERRNPLIVALGDSVTAGHFEMLVRDPADFPAFIKAGKAVEAVDERESYPQRFRGAPL